MNNYTEEINDLGFAVIPFVIEPEIVDALIGELRELSEGTRGRAGIRNLLKLSNLSRTLANSDTLRSLINPVLGEGNGVVRGLYFDKHRDANWKVAGIKISPLR